MEFKDWLEGAETKQPSLRTARKKQVYAWGKKWFGNQSRASSMGPDMAEMQFFLPNKRKVELTWQWRDMHTGKESVSIAFSQNPNTDKFSQKDKNTPFNTPMTFQAGSKEFARNMLGFIQDLKQNRIQVTYNTTGRREDIYTKWLDKANMVRVYPKGGDDDSYFNSYWWENS